MKKKILLLTTMLSMSMSFSVLTVNAAHLHVNGKEVNTSVEISDDKSMMPLRSLLEALITIL